MEYYIKRSIVCSVLFCLVILQSATGEYTGQMLIDLDLQVKTMGNYKNYMLLAYCSDL